jgi:hypothetical protein
VKCRDLFAVGVTCVSLMVVSGGRACFAQSGSSLPKCQGIWIGKVISNGSNGTARFEAELTQNGNAISGVARVSQGMTFIKCGEVSGTVAASGAMGLEINLGTTGNLSTALTVKGDAASGTYTFTSSKGSTADKGNVAITFQPGMATANISGLYFATHLSNSSGMKMWGAVFFLLQSGNNVYVSTMWDDAFVFNGPGTVIGNTISFDLAQDGAVGPPEIMSGMANFGGKVMTGGSVAGPPTDPTQTQVAFSAKYVGGILP